jgi:hypothetical protein
MLAIPLTVGILGGPYPKGSCMKVPLRIVGMSWLLGKKEKSTKETQVIQVIFYLLWINSLAWKNLLPFGMFSTMFIDLANLGQQVLTLYL